MKTHQTLIEAKRLYDLGFAIHWLKEREKRPVNHGSFSRPRESWQQLRAEFEDGYNVGVRIGSPSKLSNGYLACIDVDIHDDTFKEAAFAKLKEIIGNKVLPEVRSGSGKGSRHLYCVTAQPISPPITVEKHKGQWEIVIYSEGRQMALPPSIHPSGKPYVWKVPGDGRFPLMNFQHLIPAKEEKAKAKMGGREILDDFEIDETLDVRWLPEISDKIRSLIVSGVWKGKKVEDRSAYLLPAATSLVAARLSPNAVLTVLTDPSTYLGLCAYDHAKTKSRKRAAEWLWSYTVKRVVNERKEMRRMFEEAEKIPEIELGSFDAETQAEEIEADKDWKQDLVRCGKELINVKTCIENIILILDNAVGPMTFKRDIFAFRDVYGMDTPWGGVEDELLTDDDMVKVRVWLARTWKLDAGKDLIYDAMTFIAERNSFDPVVMWLDALPAWDRVPRLDTWLANHFGAKGEADYLAQVFRKWMVAMIARQYEPGVKFDWMPIFEGAQEMGKSSFGRLLVGDKHFLDWLPNLADKDSAIALQGMWGVELGELATMRKNEIEVIKGYITRTVDKVRPPFGRKVIEMPRRCVFYGTTNRDTYLRDETGNRRFKPVVVGRLDFDALDADRDQLFAEAKYLWDNFIETEYTLDTNGEARAYELKIQAEKMVEDDSDAMADLLSDFFEKQDDEHPIIDPGKFSMSQLFGGGKSGRDSVLAGYPYNGRNKIFAGKALKKVGATKWKSGGNSVWKLTKYVNRGRSGIGKGGKVSLNQKADIYEGIDDF